METLERPAEKEYNKNLLKTVATLFSLHNELLCQLSTLVKYSETNNELTNTQDVNAKDLIELIDLMKLKMNILLNRTLE